jgi:protein-disulfide isomerase
MVKIVRAPAILGVFAFAACSGAAQIATSQAPTDVVATVGSARLTLAEVDERALTEPAAKFGSLKLAQALYEARRTAIDEMVADKLLNDAAQAAGTDTNALVTKEITSKVTAPTEGEIDAWYKANPARVQGAALDRVREPIRSLLKDERTRTARDQYIDTLKAKTSVRVLLEPPRQKIAAAGRPLRGAADAPVEIVEFADFQCPFCEGAFPTVMQVLNTYGDKVHLVYRHFPLANHPNARPAAEAAACAAEQGKFWPYHDRLFGNQNLLGDNDLKQHAAQLGMDPSKFNACFDSKKYKKEIDDDIAAGSAAGVDGTPAFYINGREINGAQPYENFKRVIDEELQRARR